MDNLNSNLRAVMVGGRQGKKITSILLSAKVLPGMPECEGIHANEMLYGEECSNQTICLANRWL